MATLGLYPSPSSAMLNSLPTNSSKGLPIGNSSCNFSPSAMMNNNNGHASSLSVPVGAGPSNRDSSGSTNSNTGYCLKWKYHPNNLLHMFNQLLLNETFTDVVVACEGKTIKCHKIVLSACSKYFEQVFCEYPLLNSTLVILKDMKFADVQAIVEFMYQGEINVSQDQLNSLLKAAESLQVKGLADISGASGKNDVNEFMGRESGDEEFPLSPPNVCYDAGNSDGGGSMHSFQENVSVPRKRKRGRPSTITTDSNDGITTSNSNVTSNDKGVYEDFSFGGIGNLLDPHFTLQRSKKAKHKIILPGGGTIQSDDLDERDDEDGFTGEDDEVTVEELSNIVKMQEYIEQGGSRPQFWDAPTTKKIMNAIRSKKLEMKQAAEILGVSYSTLYSRYRELHGYLKMPHTQETNFNYYQVLNMLKSGQITLPDAAKRLSIQEKTLGAYLTATIMPKKPKLSIPNSDSCQDPLGSTMVMAHQGNETALDLNVKQEVEMNFDEGDDSEGENNIPSSSKIKLPAGLERDIDGEDW